MGHEVHARRNGRALGDGTTRRTRRVRTWGRLAVAASLLGGGVLLAAPGTVTAAAPVFTAWPGARVPEPSGELIPARLYMTTPGFSIPSAVAGAFTGIPVDGTMEFTGPDAIAGVDRDIQVSFDAHDDCNPVDDPDPGDPDYVVTTCPRIQLSLTSADSEGGIRFASPLTTIVEPGGDRYLHPGGAVIESLVNPGGPNPSISFNGTEAAVNDALADLVYQVGPDYRYQRYAPAGITLNVLAGLNAENVSGNIQIRVLDVNSFPTIDGPTDEQHADAQIEYRMPDVDTDPPLFTISDDDNDEDVDDIGDDTALTTPPCPADDPTFDPENDGPCSDPVDGPGTRMLLAGFLDCGQPIANNTGFHFASSTFQYDALSVDDLFTDLLAGTPLDNPEVVTAREAIKTALDAIDPSLWTFELASVNPTDYTDVFVGITTFSEVEAALSQVFFLHNAPDDTCTLVTLVSDLGNNGLPLKFVVTDENIPFGWEAPMFGFDVHETTLTTGGLQEIEIGFDVPSITLVEGDPGDPGDPATAVAGFTVSPAPHPAFTVQWEANPKSGDPVGPGQATPNTDFSGTSNNNPMIPADDTSITVGTHPALSLPDETIFRDDTDEGNEVFTYDLVLDANTAPPGYVIVPGANPTVVVTIIDDDDPDASVTTFADVSGDEGDPGDSNALTFTIGLDKPADGGETVDVALTPGSATTPGDYGAPSTATVAFAPLATSATFTVPIVGDLLTEGNHSFTATLSNSSGLSLTDTTATGTILDDDSASVVSIADVSVTEEPGDSDELTVSMTNPVRNCQVAVTTSDGSATAGALLDYDDIPGAFFDMNMVASDVLTLTINDDLEVEGDETFDVSIALTGNADPGCEIGDGEATVTIADDDSASVVSIADVSVTEEPGDSDELTVSMTNPVRNCQVAVTTSDGSATAGALLDYDDIPGAFFDMNMVASDVLTLTINDDLEVEGDETFDVSIALTGNADPGCEIGDGEATVTIADDDSPSVVSIADATLTEGVAPSQTSVSMTNFLGRTCAVSVTSADGTAEEPGDYDALTGSFSVTNQASDVLGLTIVDDDFVEADETFTVTITLDASSDPQCELGDAEATITIVSDDVASVVSIADATVTEGVAPTQATISMTNSAGRVCVLTLSSADGTAVEPDDYDAVTGQFSMTDVASDLLGLTIVDDPDPESTETFTVSMTLDASSDDQCELGDASATISILDDDAPPDLTKPSVTVEQAVGQSDPTAVAPILFTAEFSEPVTGFVDTDVTLGGTALPTSATVSGSGTTYTITVDGMSANGTVTATIGAGVAQDAASNTNDASTSVDNTVTYTGVPDVTKPSVTVEQAAGQSDPTSASPILFTVVFSEPVTGFASDDVTLGGTALPTTAMVAGSGSTYTVSVSGMAGAGTVTASVVAGAAADAASNTSLASTSVDNTVTYAPDISTPVTIDVPDDITTGTDPGQAGAVVVYGAVTTSGGVPPVTVDCTHDSGDFYPIGATLVTCTATDSSPSADTVDGLGAPQARADTTASASFSITVVDDEAPVVTVPPTGVTKAATDGTGAIVTYDPPAGSDNSGGLPVTCSPPSGSKFPIGTTTVTCTATDGSGNTTTASFAVTVTGPTSGIPATGSGSRSGVLLALLLTGVGVLLRSASRRRTPA